MNPVCQSLVEAVGLSNTYRTLSGLTLLIGIPCCLVLKQPPVYGDEDNLLEGEDGVEGEESPTSDTMEQAVHNSREFSTNPSSTGVGKNWIQTMLRKRTPIISSGDEADDTDTILCGCQRRLWTDKVFLLYMFGQLMKGIGYVFPFIHLVSICTTPWHPFDR